MAKQELKKQELTLPVEGMTCASCVAHVEKALGAVEGVDKVAVNLATERATLDYDPTRVSLSQFVRTVQDSGYDVSQETVVLPVSGMTCASCVAHVEKALTETPGVLDTAVNLATERATVTYVPGLVDRAGLVAAVREAGYDVVDMEAVAEEEAGEEERKMDRARRRMLLAWAFTAPIVLWMLPEMFWGLMWPNAAVFNAGMLLLALPVLFWAGRQTYRSAWSSLRHGNANMDVLIAMGTLSSLLTGPVALWGTLTGGEAAIANYAGVSGMIMAFHLTGRYVEATAKGRASQAIRRLLELGARTAHILVDGREKEVPIESVQVGDVMVVRPGEKVPTDGIIVEGESALDESMVTGESMPVNRGPGEEVIGATVNQDGLLKVRAARVGRETFLAQVIQLVDEAQGSKVPIQAFADRVTAIFVPVIVVIAVLTLLAWLIFPSAMGVVAERAAGVLPWVNPELGAVTLAIFATVAVLVIACPCALGLATPTALMVGSGIGAQNGILIRSGEAIQTLKDLRVIVFDKTGTLTKGRPEVTDLAPLGVAERELLRWAASAELGSEHPLGRAVVERARAEELELSEPVDFQIERGRGVRAQVEGRPVLVGSPRFMQEAGLDLGPLQAEVERLEGEAKTVMLAARAGQLLGAIAVADTLKADAVAAVGELERMGLRTVMLTGDNRRTAEAIARQVGISRVLAEVLPEGKVEEIRRLQQEASRVGMVGDGINDAPALTQADVGIAIGSGTDIAIEAADITLVRGNLSEVVKAVNLSRATFRKIVQNLFWAFFYNVIMIPLAVLGLMHPVLAEIAMATSSITVVSNANLLRRVDIRPGYERG
ncbi:MAG: copper-translocating P-type ATPase [Chloroflexia bacterium]|nr:copper-translocating P-type ATPase [Chloroflexia bacterium]